jgi:hypothetical protein
MYGISINEIRLFKDGGGAIKIEYNYWFFYFYLIS